MTKRLAGKVALVTAAGQGIGRAIAEAFIAEGATVIATDLDESKVKGLGAMAAKLDVRLNEAVEVLAKEVTAKYGPLDILANVAGYVHNGTIFETSDKDWDFSFDL